MYLFTMIALVILTINSYGQVKPTGQKAVETAKKINNTAAGVSDASNKIAEQAKQSGEHIKNVAENVKAIIQVFEPIVKIHFKKKGNATTTAENGSAQSSSIYQKEESNSSPVMPPTIQNQTNPNTQVENTVGGNPSATTTQSYQPESASYNGDGSANWGNQYNAEYGNYLDAFTGTILDGGSAEDNPASIDLIFLAPNDGQNAYYILTPNFAHDNGSADAFWGSATTDNPVKAWRAVNESEVALTILTGQQFEKIQYNEQLRGAIKQAKGFASFFSSTSKLDGKVFAVKTEMADRTAYALVYVVRHMGTSGSNGHLKVKIKCTGIDNNGDGNPEQQNYSR